MVVLFQVLLPVFFEDFWNDRTLRRCSIILHFHIFFYFDWVYLERRWKSRAKSPFGFLRRLQQMFWIRFDEISFGANDARSKCKKNSVSSFYFLSGVDSFWGKVMNISVVQPFQSGAFYSRRSLTFVLTPSSRLFVPTIDLRSARTSWSLLWWHRWCCCVASREGAGPRSFSNYETKAEKNNNANNNDNTRTIGKTKHNGKMMNDFNGSTSRPRNSLWNVSNPRKETGRVSKLARKISDIPVCGPILNIWEVSQANGSSLKAITTSRKLQNA